MRLIFAGTPEFARVALERLHAAGHDIALVLSQPDRPAGRGMKLQASAVKQLALLFEGGVVGILRHCLHLHAILVVGTANSDVGPEFARAKDF